ncbi:hypothetical protein FBU30_000206 [Linnemannia zychae]|nr:hypothetical protein FBU30_000206 [Linnemannia zychae]
MTQYKYDVTMTCDGCTGAITRVLNRLKGVDKFEVSLEAQSVIVDSNTLSENSFPILGPQVLPAGPQLQTDI